MIFDIEDQIYLRYQVRHVYTISTVIDICLCDNEVLKHRYRWPWILTFDHDIEVCYIRYRTPSISKVDIEVARAKRRYRRCIPWRYRSLRCRRWPSISKVRPSSSMISGCQGSRCTSTIMSHHHDSDASLSDASLSDTWFTGTVRLSPAAEATGLRQLAFKVRVQSHGWATQSIYDSDIHYRPGLPSVTTVVVAAGYR